MSEEDLIINENVQGCEHCHYSGMLICLTINGTGQTYLFDFRSYEKQLPFIKKNKHRLTFDMEFFPCCCAKGTLQNKKGEADWLSDSQRFCVLARSFREADRATELFFCDEWLTKLNEYKAGRPYQIRKPQKEEVNL